MTKPFNKFVSLDERERLFFSDVPDGDDFARRDISRSGNTSTTAAPWMVSHPPVELEQEGKQRFNGVGDIVEYITATLRAYFGSVLPSFIQFCRRHLQNLEDVRFLQTVSRESEAWELRRQIFHVTKCEPLRMRNTYDAMQKNITGVP